MFTVSRTGSIADVIAQVRDIPARVIPYAASTALTRVAEAGRVSLIEQMTRVFDRPTPYTLNSLRIVPSTTRTLLARVMVKDQAGAGGVKPENYLEPEVEGGPRNEKRYERALRFAGILRPGERTVIGRGAVLDAYGNLSGGVIRQILSQVGAQQKVGKGPRRLKRGAGGVSRAYVAGAVGRKGTRGIFLREGRTLKPILIFTKAQPQYRKRLDFAGIVRAVAERQFEAEFNRAAASILKR